MHHVIEVGGAVCCVYVGGVVGAFPKSESVLRILLVASEAGPFGTQHALLFHCGWLNLHDGFGPGNTVVVLVVGGGGGGSA